MGCRRDFSSRWLSERRVVAGKTGAQQRWPGPLPRAGGSQPLAASLQPGGITYLMEDKAHKVTQA